MENRFYQKNPGLVISKFNFCSIFSDAWLKAITPSNVIAGFRKAGIFPMDREKILSLIEMQSMYYILSCVCMHLLFIIMYCAFPRCQQQR